MAEEQKERQYTHAEAGEILERAAEIQQDAAPSEMAYTEETLEAGAKAAGIQEEFVEEAIEEVQLERQELRKRRQALRRNLTIGGVIASVVLFLSFFTSQRSLNGALAMVDARRSQLETVLQRRHDLIPSLISVAKTSAAHERELIASLDQQQQELRGATGGFVERLRREQELGESIQELLNSMRTSGRGGSDDLYIRLVDELAGAENRVAAERKRYNDAAAEYNRTARSLPTSLFRPILGYAASQPYLQASSAAQRPPEL